MLGGSRRQQEAAYYNSKTYARHFQSFVQVLRSRLSEDDVADFMDAYDDYQSSRQLREFLNIVVPLLDTAQKRQSILVALHDVLPLADRTKYETIVAQYRLLPSSPAAAAAIVKAPSLQSRPRSMPTPNGWATPPPSDVASSTQFSSATSPRRRPLSTATTNSNEKTTKVTLRRADGESFGFSLRGGAERSLGVYVSSVDDGSAGQKAGLKAGMQIMKVNDVGFEGFTTSQAIRFFHETKKLRMHVVDRGRYPGTYVAQRRYNWVDQAGRPVSPPPQPRTVKTGDEEGRSDLRLLSNADEKRVNVVVREGQRLGISVRGGSEYGIGIFVSSVVDGSVADDAGLKAGDQIINVNGKTFLHITNEEAIRILKAESLTMMMMTIKDIGKIPYSLVKYDQTKWVSTKDLPTQRDSVPYQSATMPTRGKKADRDLPLTRRPPSYYNSSSVQSGFSTFKPETSAVEEEEEEESEEERPSLNKKRAGSAAFKHGMGTQLVLRTTQVHTARGQITDKARLVLTQQQFDTLAYYLDEYQANSISVEDMAEVLLQLFDTPKKIALLVEIRQIILPKDIDKFENLVMAREVESMNRARSESTNRLLKRGETFDTPPVRRRAADDELEEESNRTSVTVQVHRTSAEIAHDREDDPRASLSTHKSLVATPSDAPSVIEAVNAIAAAIEGADDDEDAEDDDSKRGEEENEGRTEEDEEDEDEDEDEEREEDRGGERQQILSAAAAATAAAAAAAQQSPPPVFRAPSPPPQDASDESSSESDVEEEEEVVARAKKAEPSRPSPSLRFHVPPPPPPAPQQESDDDEDIKEEKKEALRLVPQISVSDESATPPIFRVPSPPPYDQEDSSSGDDDDDEEESSTTRTTPSSAKKPAPMAVSLPGLSVGGLDLVRSPSQHKMIHETLTERRRRIHPGSVSARSRRSVSADSATTDVSVDDDTFDASYQDSPPVRRDEVGEPEQSSTPLRKDLASTFEEEKRREEEERKKRLIEEEEERLAAEEERRKREAEERRQKEAEEKRKQEEAEERRKQEEADMKRRQEEAEARRRREAEEKRMQEEAEERRQEEAEEKQRQEERKEAEEKKKQREAEERMRREREEQEQRRKEEEEKARIAAAAAAKGERGDDEVVDSLPPKQIRLRLKRGESNRESMVFTEDAQRAEEAAAAAAAAVVQRRAAQEMAKGNDAARPEDLYAVPVKPKKLSGATPPPPAEQPQSRTVAGYTGLTGAIVNILVPKSKPKLGMGVDGGESTKQKAVRVRLISAGGCASLVAPPLKLGQQILSIDNVSLKGKTHKQAVASIKEAFDSRRTEMTLTVHEDEEVEKMANAKRK